MHRTIANVFKVLIFSFLFMFLLDTTLLLVQVISIHSEVSNMTGVMQTEIARNNCMPSEMADSFIVALDELKSQYNVGQRNPSESPFMTYKSNLKNNVSLSNGDSYKSLSPNISNVKEYGDFQQLALEVTLHPMYAYFSGSSLQKDTSNILTINIRYIYNVPCLRYLK